ncbi:MAG: hypothetical protein HZA52_21440 [Planctomycetes bacterium]|nr:hypothetical protein [Planctomycetota bacterium]
MNLALLVCAALAAEAHATETHATDASRLRIAELAATGPLASATLDFGGAGRATLLLDLAAGESRTLNVPLPTREGFDALVPSVSDPRLRFVGWRPDAERERAFAALPLALRTRSAPPPPARSLAPSLAALTLVVAGVLFVSRVRANRARALLVGALTAVAVLSLELAFDAPPRTRIVLDFELGADGSVGDGVRWVSARDRLDLGVEPPLALAVEPAQTALDVRIDARGAGPARTTVLGTGALLGRADAAREAPPDRAGNRWGDLAAVWTRDEAGTWTEHGTWPFASPLPAALAGDRRPPGWINPALPQGRKLLIGLASEPEPGAASPGARPPGVPSLGVPSPGPEVWIRVTGP